MLALALTTVVSLAPGPATNEPAPPCPNLTTGLLADPAAFARITGDEPWQHYPDELRDRQLLSCLVKQYLGYPLRGKGTITQAEATAASDIAALVRSLAPTHTVQVVIDGAEDIVPFASGRYKSEDDYAEAADRHEQRAEARAKSLARRVKSMVPSDIAVDVGTMRLNEEKGRRGVLVFVRYTRKPAPTLPVNPVEPTVQPVPRDSDTRPTPAAPLSAPAPIRAPITPPRWMVSPYVRVFYVFGHGNSYVWDRGGEVAGGLHFSRRFKRWALEFSGEFRHASIRAKLEFEDGTDPLSVKHYLFPVMLGVSHRGLVAGVEFAAGYLDERLHPELAARQTIRRASLATGLYAGYRLPLPNSTGPWVELGYLFSWVHSPRFPAFEQGLGHVHSVSVRVGWGFSRKRRTK